MDKVRDFILGGSKITADGDCSHEIKRHLLLGRKAMTNLDSILKSRDIQFSSVAHSCPTLWDPMNRSMPGLPVLHQLPEFTQTEGHQVGDPIQPSHPLSSPFPPAPIPPSIRVFSNESILRMRWPKYWSFSFSISPSNEHPGVISFRTDWLDLLAVQGTLKTLLPNKVHLVKAMVFPVVMYTCESWAVKKAKCQKIDTFEL